MADRIQIKPENKGKLHASLGVPQDQPIPLADLMRAKRSRNPKTRKRAAFALAARSWRRE